MSWRRTSPASSRSTAWPARTSCSRTTEPNCCCGGGSQRGRRRVSAWAQGARAGAPLAAGAARPPALHSTLQLVSLHYESVESSSDCVSAISTRCDLSPASGHMRLHITYQAPNSMPPGCRWPPPCGRRLHQPHTPLPCGRLAGVLIGLPQHSPRCLGLTVPHRS